MQNRIGIIIVAAGQGLRAGGDLPKQWQVLDIAGGERRVIDHAIAAFLSHAELGQSPAFAPADLVIVTREQDVARLATYQADGHQVVAGGATRGASVLAGLMALGAGVTHVLIHDAARPFLSAQVISGVIEGLTDSTGAAPGLAVSDALWRVENGGITGTQDRGGLFAAQTPQGFPLVALRAAHMAAAARGDAPFDDVEVARASGMTVVQTIGDIDNFKITGPDDLARAHRVLQARAASNNKETPMDIRLGNGYDVHRFCDGDHVILCGISVPHDRGLSAHSDGDVGMHALTDAIYGALADGDIGQHFPPSQDQWKGADSAIFLRHAVARAAERGFAISNCDVTLVCEEPKIGPQAAAMRARLAEIMGLDLGRVSVKATTSERLGFTGRREGIAAIATACLVATPGN